MADGHIANNMDRLDPDDRVANDVQRIRFLITGLPKCGKSTIKRVVFQNQKPSTSFMIENAVDSDNGTSVVALNSFVQLQITTSGHENDPDQVYENVRSVIFVIDLLDDYLLAITELCKLVEHTRTLSGQPDFDVFLHKSDGLSLKARQEVLGEISRQVKDELGPETAPLINFYLTSLYDYSILHAISRVIQRHLDINRVLAAALDDFCKVTGFQRAYIFDIISKIYIAADSSPHDSKAYELCNDALDVVDDIAVIYANPSREGAPIAEISLDSGNKIMYLTLGGKGLALLLFAYHQVPLSSTNSMLLEFRSKLIELLK